MRRFILIALFKEPILLGKAINVTNQLNPDRVDLGLSAINPSEIFYTDQPPPAPTFRASDLRDGLYLTRFVFDRLIRSEDNPYHFTVQWKVFELFPNNSNYFNPRNF